MDLRAVHLLWAILLIILLWGVKLLIFELAYMKLKLANKNFTLYLCGEIKIRIFKSYALMKNFMKNFYGRPKDLYTFSTRNYNTYL